MNTPTVQRFRWFWAWDDEKEEFWLRQMALAGFHLVSPNPFGVYTFSPGEKQDVAYRLDYATSKYNTAEYYQLFQDAGWEHVGQMGGWQYWRKPVSSGQEAPEIFTDNESKIQKYRRVLGVMIIVLPLLTIGLINISNHARTSWSGAIIFINGMVAILLCYAAARIVLRIRALQRR